jgi:hypothetical protein
LRTLKSLFLKMLNIKIDDLEMFSPFLCACALIINYL